jgi:superfamily II DNA or RNA helicase
LWRHGVSRAAGVFPRVPRGAVERIGQDAPVASSGWEACAFRRDLRRHQSLALEAVDRAVEQGERRAYVVLPPGAGKTAVGLEAARRLGRRTLVLTPQTVVQAQWLEQWRQFAPPGSDHPVPAGLDPSLADPLTVLTYQSLSAWDRTADDQDVEDDASAGAAARRRAAVRGDAGSDLLDLLHPAGRELVDRAAGQGPWTLVLDEVHHLLEAWGALVSAVVAALGEQTWVLGLTATPPTELPPAQRGVQQAVFGPAWLEVPLPAAVKEGDVAPYQELVFLTAPTAEEDRWIERERERFAALQDELLVARAGTVPLPDWLDERLGDRRAPDGTALPWREVESAEPDVARAALRLAGTGAVPVPEGARLREEHRTPPDSRDWAALLQAYARENLVPSRELADERLLRTVREVLPSLGWQLTIRGLRSVTSPVDRTCALSASKPAAAVEILAAERGALGDDLRALVLCDVERRLPVSPPSGDSLRPAVRPAGSARLALAELAASELGPALRPVMVSGRNVLMRRQDVPQLRSFAPTSLASRLRVHELEGSDELVALVADAPWSAGVWTPLLTAWLQAGGTQAIVGTRALLGEGWDCPALNVVVDLTATATSTSLAQVRGRSLRLDPARPGKVADNWTVVTVADDHPRGDADYLRAVRKHAAHLAPGPEGEIESGIGHCDDALGPYGPPPAAERAAVNARALARAAAKDSARDVWGVGKGYEGTQVETVRVRSEVPLGLPGGVLPPALLRPATTLGTQAQPLVKGRRPAPLWPIPTGAGLVAAGGAVAAGADPAPAGVVGGATLGVSAVVLGGVRYGTQLRNLRNVPADGQAATLRQLAAAVADALHATGGTTVGASAVSVRAGRDGWVRCELEADDAQSRLFAACLDELLAPLVDPRWLVSRLVLPVPATAAERRRLAVARTVGRPVDAAVAWHAVPAELGRSKTTVAAFDDAWHTHVGTGRVVAGREAEGQALVALLRGADPFRLTSRVRAVWR